MRRIVVPLMIVAGLIASVGAVLAIYVLDTVVDSDEFASRTADALSEPVVGELIAEKVVDQIVEAKPNTLAALRTSGPRNKLVNITVLTKCDPFPRNSHVNG